jgi:hypothetical protein
MAGQKKITIDGIKSSLTNPNDADIIAGEESTGADFQITAGNAFREKASTGYDNYLLDGDLTFWDYGTNFNTPAYTGYGPNMWYLDFAGTSSAFTRNNLYDSNIAKYYANFFKQSTGLGGSFGQKIKDATILSGKNVSAFILLRSASGVEDFRFQIIMDKNGTTQTTTSTGQEIPNDNTWRWYRFDIANPTITGTINADNFTHLLFYNDHNQQYFLDIQKARVIETPIDLPDGAIPEWIKEDEDPLIVKPKVKQYAFRMLGDSTTYGSFMFGRGNSGSQMSVMVPTSNTMVKVPTLTETGNRAVNVTAGTLFSWVGPTFSNTWLSQRMVSARYATSGSLVVNNGYFLYFTTTGEYLDVDSRY